MLSLYNSNGDEVTDPDMIKEEVFNFYKTLYSSKESNIHDVDLDQLLKPETPKLSDAEALQLEGKITLYEAATVLKNMQNNKSPGSTGFTVEFFKFFWKDLGVFLVKSINFGFNVGMMSITQREGIITCVPKGDKSKKFVKNWRPISLLNISYKIASGCIASRLKNVLPSIIDCDQSGFMANRFMGDNIRLLYDILKLSYQNKKPGILLLIDLIVWRGPL